MEISLFAAVVNIAMAIWAIDRLSRLEQRVEALEAELYKEEGDDFIKDGQDMRGV
jgi:BMFP domain-containing protein YqiC